MLRLRRLWCQSSVSRASSASATAVVRRRNTFHTLAAAAATNRATVPSARSAVMDPATRLLYARYRVTPVSLLPPAVSQPSASASSDAKAAAPAKPAAAAAAAEAAASVAARNAPPPAAAEPKADKPKPQPKADKPKADKPKAEPKPKAAAEPKAKVDKPKDATALRMAEEGRKRAEAMKNMTADEKKAYRKAEDAKKAADAAAAAATKATPAAAAGAGAGAGAGAKAAGKAAGKTDAKDQKTAAAAAGDDEADVAVKVPKGTRDIKPEQMTIREKAFAMIRGVFQRHGAVEIDTPVFELKETLTNKYGEDSKLIYELADQGGELLALRYDLTVPFARYLASYKVGNIKRFHIGRVYRRDNPVMSRGRFREFYQCDFDIAGYESAPPMLVDAECLKVLAEILDKLQLEGGYRIKLNHRKLLDAIMAVAGVPADRFRTVCSAIDKLDKEPWANGAVRQEIIDKLCPPDGKDAAADANANANAKPLVKVSKAEAAKIADAIGEFVKIKGLPFPTLEKLKAQAQLTKNASAIAAFEELKAMFNFMNTFKMLERIELDMSLARGLDYYTGVIYEATLIAPGGVDVGSIAAGGRYDGLVGMFSGKAVPAVGVSVGIERIFNIIEEQERKRAGGIRRNHTQVLICTIGKDLLDYRLALATELWSAGIAAEFEYHSEPKPKEQAAHAADDRIPITLWVGKDEVTAGQVTVKDMRGDYVFAADAKDRAKNHGTKVARAELVSYLRKLLASA